MPAKEGIILESLPGLSFRVRIKGLDSSASPEGGDEVLCYLAGRMKMNHIRVMPGDRVLVEMSPDGRRGRIVRRL